MKAIRDSHPTVQSPTANDTLDVLDEQGNPTGGALARKEIHRLGKLHRAIHLYLFDQSNNLLLQKRSSQVDHYPNMFSISVVGHVNAGENSYEAVARELQEELRLDPKHVQIYLLFSIRRDAYLSPSYIDRQWNDIYVGWADFKLYDIAFDRDVISEVRLVSFEAFDIMVKQSSEELAPVYQEDWSQLVRLVRDRLSLDHVPKVP